MTAMAQALTALTMRFMTSRVMMSSFMRISVGIAFAKSRRRQRKRHCPGGLAWGRAAKPGR
jgi:hypothetical protein